MSNCTQLEPYVKIQGIIELLWISRVLKATIWAPIGSSQRLKLVFFWFSAKVGLVYGV
jgi:hypothetical protein